MCTSCEQHMVMNFFRLESLKPCDYSFPTDIDICLRRLRRCYCLCTLRCIHHLPLFFLFPGFPPPVRILVLFIRCWSYHVWLGGCTGRFFVCWIQAFIVNAVVPMP